MHTHGIENVPRETPEEELEKLRRDDEEPATADHRGAVERRTVTVEGGNRAARRRALKGLRKRGAGYTRTPEETR